MLPVALPSALLAVPPRLAPELPATLGTPTFGTPDGAEMLPPGAWCRWREGRIERGVFAKHGLELDIVYTRGSQMTSAALLSGERGRCAVVVGGPGEPQSVASDEASST